MRTVTQLMNLSGRTALVTGGAGHVAFALEETLLELGATVAITDSDAKACEQRMRALCRRVTSTRVFTVPCDLADERATRQMVRRVIRRARGLDILVHCAAYTGSGRQPGWAVSFAGQTVDAWDAAMRVNLTAAFVLAQDAQRALEASGYGSIILLSSIYGVVAPDWRLYEGTAIGNPVGYGVSKGGLLQLTRYLATMFAPRVRVNVISPGGIWRDQPEVFRQRYISRTPLGRMATEEDLKGAVAFLASDLSAYVTGQNLIVDGGWTAW